MVCVPNRAQETAVCRIARLESFHLADDKSFRL